MAKYRDGEYSKWDRWLSRGVVSRWDRWLKRGKDGQVVGWRHGGYVGCVAR
jgi:hypothetical protein